MKKELLIIIAIAFLTGITKANPIEEPFIQEVSVSPPWIEVTCWNSDELIGRTITTREGTAEILSAYPGDNCLAVLDSSNTTGFYLDPEGDSITIESEYQRLCSCIGYGIYGESAGSPLPGNSIVSDFYFYGEGDFPPQYWYFSYCTQPTPGEYGYNDWWGDPPWGTSDLILNELTLSSNWREHGVFIELINAGDEPVSTSNYCLISNIIYNLPPDQSVRPGQYFIIDESDCPELFNLNSHDVVYLVRRGEPSIYYIVDQVGWDVQFIANTSIMRYPDADVDWGCWDDFRGFNTETSYTFENGFPTRGAANRHESPGFVVIGARADSTGEGAARIHWTDPIWDEDFDYSVLVSNDDHFPQTSDDGNTIYQGTGREFNDSNIPPVGPTFYTLFAHNIGGDYSTPTGESQAYIYFNSAGIEEQNLPSKISYLNCYPNPFNARTTISFAIEKAGDVEVTIYDISGRLVETVAKGYYNAGKYSVSWNADKYSSGVYLARLMTDSGVQSIRMVLLK